ncbi:MAG: alanine racemase [Hamadaea sp.]|uniref:alanine racemase n=1 Tax=Hamadaea sp. TaxID=2024425 RepID=UPI0017F68D89|nr:alanine racemase [Hamadaea sp.]NUR70970.1 alanine racemase [Hamadaea sp.]NUT20081.1 alanine racemase [Hamadaea sp.]
MWQAEAVVDLAAIRANVALLRKRTSAEVMAVVKADGYGHGAVPSARAALAGGATWLGVRSLPEALELRAAGVTAPVLAWLLPPGTPLPEGVAADVDLSVSSVAQVTELAEAARRAGKVARAHLKIDTGLHRNGATLDVWPKLVEAAAKAQAEGVLEIVAVWSHLACADVLGDPSIDRQLDVFLEASAIAERLGVTPRLRHLANSAATLTRPDTHFDLVRPGVAVYGLSPIEGQDFGLRPAMTVRAPVALVKRVPAGEGVSYGHTYVTPRETTLCLIPIGYADGVPRHASSSGPVWVNGKRFEIAGRVCMDQFVVDCDDAVVAAGDEAVLFGPGDRGEPTADDWAAVVGTINYEIVTRFGRSGVPRRYRG